MKNRRLWLIFFAVYYGTYWGQSTIVGFAPQFKQQRFYLWTEEDFLSGKKRMISDTLVDERGMFRFSLPKGPILKYHLGTENFNGYLFAENGGQYRLEFFSDSPLSQSYNLHEEIEFVFIDLDSNDINFKILGFEAWLDNQLSDIHFENNSEGELFRKISLLKYNALQDVRRDSSVYFREFIGYSMAENIENMSYRGSPTKEEKFNTYFNQRPIRYDAPYYTNYFLRYYDQYISQISHESAIELFKAYASQDLAAQDRILAANSCTGDTILRNLINLYILKQAINGNFIPKSVVKSNLLLQQKLAPCELHRKIAANLLQKFSGLETGDSFPFESLQILPFDQKYVYVHAYNPSNTQCIQELNALKKLKAGYGSTVEFLTLYLDKPLSNEAERKALSQITWKKIGLRPDDPAWNLLGISTYPYYILVDKDSTVLKAPALTPTPNGKYETIEKTFFELTKP